jgi:hypothetical protein
LLEADIDATVAFEVAFPQMHRPAMISFALARICALAESMNSFAQLSWGLDERTCRVRR